MIRYFVSLIINSNLDNMKNIYLLLCISVIAFAGCNSPKSKSVVYAHGRPGDIVVVMSNERWNSESGDTLRAIFHEDYPGLPMEEPIFDLHQIPKEKFVEHNMYHKNIIFQEINPNAEKTTIKIIKNKYAHGQLFIYIIAKNQAEFVQIVDDNKGQLLELFTEADRNRWITNISKYTNNTVSNNLLKKYDISIKIPKGYYLDVLKDDFAWISNETRKYTLNILVYTYPISDSTNFDINYLISKRNEIVKANVPGANPNSYMSTEIKYDFPVLNIMNHNDIPTAVLRGLWKVKGDFMGGPFISFTKIDEARNRVVTIEGFVYHPNEEVRDQIRQLEGILYTFDLVK